MATPVAHASFGIACLALVHVAAAGRFVRPLPWLAAACAFAACSPDLDIAASLLGTGTTTAWHSGPTHSLSFALLVGLLAWLLLRRRADGGPLAIALGLATASHVAVDYFTGPQVGLHESYGLPALWPLVDERLKAPLTLFRGVQHGGIAIWFTPRNLGTAAIELMYAVPLIWLSWRALRHRGASDLHRPR